MRLDREAPLPQSLGMVVFRNHKGQEGEAGFE